MELNFKEAPMTKNHIKVLIALLLSMFIGYMLFHDLTGETLLSYNIYDSYSIQAENWLNGSISLQNGEVYSTWLEIAFYDGAYYLSFPPVPSVIVLPFVAILGSAQAVPSNFIIAMFGMLTAAGVFSIFAARNSDEKTCLFWALFVTLGSNTFWLSTSGGVWFMAQVLNLCFLIWGIFFAQKQTWQGNCFAAILFSLAVGCRPFSILILALFFLWVLTINIKEYIAIFNWVFTFGLPFILSASIGLCIAWYNYIRFDDILEFGHSYLYEFIYVGDQFSHSYIWTNILRLLRPITITSNFGIDFPIFDGFMFFIANPIFLMWSIYAIKRVLAKKFKWQEIALIITFIFAIIFYCAHRTLGTWQFGARYMVDLIPYVILAECLYLPSANITKQSQLSEQRTQINIWEWFILSVAVMFNIYGAIFMNLQ